MAVVGRSYRAVRQCIFEYLKETDLRYDRTMEGWFEINARKCDELAFAWLQAQGLDPTEFVRESSPPTFRIVHLPTKEYFAFGGESGGAKWTRPGFNLKLSQTPIGQPQSWDVKLERFKRWALDLKEYLAALDKHRSSLLLPSPLRTEPPPPIPPVDVNLRTVRPTTPPPIPPVDIDLRTVRPTTPPPIPPVDVDLRTEDQSLIPQLGPPPTRVKTPPPISVSVLLRKLHMTWIRDLRLHVDALQSAMESDKKFFAAIIPYVNQLARVVRLPSTEVTKSMFVAPLKRLLDFYADYQAEPGTLYFPPVETSNTEDIVKEIADLITKLTTLSDDQFVDCFQPAPSPGRTTSRFPGGEIKATAVFVGHGRSKEWLELEKFLKGDLHLHCEEFNTEPTAG
jgi:hypothetical protein